MLFDMQKFHNVVVEELPVNVWPGKELNVVVASSKEVSPQRTLTSQAEKSASRLGFSRLFHLTSLTFSASTSFGLLGSKQRHNAITSHKISPPLFALAESNRQAIKGPQFDGCQFETKMNEFKVHETFDLMGLMENLSRSIHAYAKENSTLCEGHDMIQQAQSGKPERQQLSASISLSSGISGLKLEQEEREQREKMEKQKEKDVAEKKSKAAKASKGSDAGNASKN
ncbi:hypothetical protein LguiA_012905 [Lonicera macranthoides]